MGLDPINLASISALLFKVANTSSPRVLLALRPQDLLPDWITHVVFLGSNLRILHQGRKEHIQDELKNTNLANTRIDQLPTPGTPIGIQDTTVRKLHIPNDSRLEVISNTRTSRDGLPYVDTTPHSLIDANEPLVEMEKVQIKYGSKQVLGGWKEKVDGVEREGLWWTIRRGERWAVFGPNGNLPDCLA